MEFLPKICILKLDIRPNYRPNIRPFLAEYSVSADTSFSCIGRSLLNVCLITYITWRILKFWAILYFNKSAWYRIELVYDR